MSAHVSLELEDVVRFAQQALKGTPPNLEQYFGGYTHKAVLKHVWDNFRRSRTKVETVAAQLQGMSSYLASNKLHKDSTVTQAVFRMFMRGTPAIKLSQDSGRAANVAAQTDEEYQSFILAYVRSTEAAYVAFQIAFLLCDAKQTRMYTLEDVVLRVKQEPAMSENGGSAPLVRAKNDAMVSLRALEAKLRFCGLNEGVRACVMEVFNIGGDMNQQLAAVAQHHRADAVAAEERLSGDWAQAWQFNQPPAAPAARFAAGGGRARVSRASRATPSLRQDDWGLSEKWPPY